MEIPAQWSLDLGARYVGHGTCEFRVWAPSCFSLELHFLQDNRVIAMEQQSEGYFSATQDIEPGKSYFYRLNGATDRPDPASRAQPEGVLLVHGPSLCRGEDYCTPALTHEEAIRASEIKKTWNDDKLYVRPVRNHESS